MSAELFVYFAYGSMMNKVSLGARNLKPLRSEPSILQSAYHLAFDAKTGMATLDEDIAGEEHPKVHGVLHWLSTHDQAALDKIEHIYDRLPMTAQTYGGEHVACSGYVMKQAVRVPKDKRPLPTERYLDICATGAESHGVASEYVQWLRALPRRPRQTHREYRSLGSPPPDAPIINSSELPTFAAAQGERDPPAEGMSHSFVGLNGKVVKLQAPKDFMAGMWSERNGQEITVWIANLLWEPLYGLPPKSLEAMTAEHRAYSENCIAEFAFGPIGSTFPSLLHAHVVGTLDY